MFVLAWNWDGFYSKCCLIFELEKRCQTRNWKFFLTSKFWLCVTATVFLVWNLLSIENFKLCRLKNCLPNAGSITWWTSWSGAKSVFWSLSHNIIFPTYLNVITWVLHKNWFAGFNLAVFVLAWNWDGFYSECCLIFELEKRCQTSNWNFFLPSKFWSVFLKSITWYN